VYKTSKEITDLGRLQQKTDGFESVQMSKEEQRRSLRAKLKQKKDRRINNPETVLLVTGGRSGRAKANMSIARNVLSTPGGYIDFSC